MTYPDYYRLLQVHPDASQEVIQAAYRRLARMHHPDAGGTDDASMRALNEAYEVLSDPLRREAFDRWYRNQMASQDVLSSQPGGAPEHPGSGLPVPGAPTPRSLWRALVPVVLSLLVLSVLVLDVWRLGLRGFPEITLVLVACGWLLYHFSGLRDLWR